MVCDYRPYKQEKYRIRLPISGYRLLYNDDVYFLAASLLETKFLLKSIISNASKGTRFMTLHIKDFPFKHLWNAQNICVYIPNFFLKIWKIRITFLHWLLKTDLFTAKSKRGMYGLTQAARLAYDNLVSNLKNDRYFPDKYCPNICSHESHHTKICLYVDVFWCKIFNKRWCSTSNY